MSGEFFRLQLVASSCGHTTTGSEVRRNNDSVVAGQSLGDWPLPDYSLVIDSFALEVAPRRFIKTTAYNSQSPGPLLRMKEGVPVTIDVTNPRQRTRSCTGTGCFFRPRLTARWKKARRISLPERRTSYTFTPEPAGFRWYHTHVWRAAI